MKDSGLTYTKEDREKTLKKIKDRTPNKDRFFSYKRKVMPILSTSLIIVLVTILLYPNLQVSNEANQGNSTKPSTSQQEEVSFSALLIGKDSTNHRNNLTILLTFNSHNNSMKLVPLPPDLYIDILNGDGDIIKKDKIIHALAKNSNPEAVLNTVSHLFKIPIDYYSIVPEQDIYNVIGISLDDEEKFISPKELVISLEKVSFNQFKTLMEKGENNLDEETLNYLAPLENRHESIRAIDIEAGTEEKYINGIYYKEIKKEILEKTSNILNEHIGKNEPTIK
jgi:polyisoprenyl-teichoic acid--peptidoglycan teichoic acid transferase